MLLCGIVSGSELKSFKQTLSKTDYKHHHQPIVKLFSSKNGFLIFKLLQRARSMCLLYSMFLKLRAAKSVGEGVLLTFFLVLVTNFFLKGLLFGTIFFLTNFQQNAQKQLHAKILLIMLILVSTELKIIKTAAIKNNFIPPLSKKSNKLVLNRFEK